MTSNFSVGDIIRVPRKSKGVCYPALILEASQTVDHLIDDEHDQNSESPRFRVRYFTSSCEEGWISARNVRIWRPLSMQKQSSPPKALKDAYKLAEEYLVKKNCTPVETVIHEQSQLIITPETPSNAANPMKTPHARTQCAPKELSYFEAEGATSIMNSAENNMRSTSSLLDAGEARISNFIDRNGPVMHQCVASQPAATQGVKLYSIFTRNLVSQSPLSRTAAPSISTSSTYLPQCNAIYPTSNKVAQNQLASGTQQKMDFAPFTCHLSPLYRIIHIDCTKAVRKDCSAGNFALTLPLNVFHQHVGPKRAFVMIAPLDEDTVHPCPWPRMKDFLLQVNGSTLPASAFPSPWSLKKANTNAPQCPRSLIYLFADITQQVTTCEITLTFRRKLRDAFNTSENSVRPWRFGLFVLSFSEISKFLPKIEPLLEKRKWKDDRLIDNEQDDVVVDNFVAISLKCPISLVPIRKPVRGALCTHPQVIDLSSFISHIHQTKQWKCPLCALVIDCIWDIVVDIGLDDVIAAQKTEGKAASKALLYPSGKAEVATLKGLDDGDPHESNVRTFPSAYDEHKLNLSLVSEKSNTKESAMVID